MREFSMLRDGRYAAWFRTSHGEGTGIVDLADGIISGGDSIFTYSGTYDVVGDRFTAVLTTSKRAVGPPTVLGIDEVELKLAGRFHGRIASCSGTADQAPGVVFEATLFLSEDQPPAPDRKCTTSRLDPGKLPKGADNRSRAPHPFPRGLSSQR
jgi:hypothetical protein